MRFESKRDAWLVVIALLSPIFAFAVIANRWYVSRHDVRGPLAGALIVVFAVVAFVWLLFRSTYYIVDRDTLVIRSAFLTWRVPIREITAITPTNSILASPALSLDRLRIDYGGTFIMVSPADKNAFIDALRAVNPAIIRPE